MEQHSRRQKNTPSKGRGNLAPKPIRKPAAAPRPSASSNLSPTTSRIQTAEQRPPASRPALTYQPRPAPSTSCRDSSYHTHTDAWWFSPASLVLALIFVLGVIVTGMAIWLF